MPIPVRMDSKLDICTTRSTLEAEKLYVTHPGHRYRDIPAFGPDRLNSNLRTHSGTKCQSVAGRGSKLGTSPIPRAEMVQKPYATHPRHASRDIHGFGPDRFNRNLRSRWGAERRSLPGRARNLMPTPSRVRGRRRSGTEQTRVTDPEVSLLSARMGLIVIHGEQNADAWADGLETRHPHYPECVEGGEAVRNPSESRIPRYPYFRPESV